MSHDKDTVASTPSSVHNHGPLRRDSSGFVDTTKLIADIRALVGEEAGAYIRNLIENEETMLQRWREEQSARRMAERARDDYRATAAQFANRINELEVLIARMRSAAQELRALL